MTALKLVSADEEEEREASCVSLAEDRERGTEGVLRESSSSKCDGRPACVAVGSADHEVAAMMGPRLFRPLTSFAPSTTGSSNNMALPTPRLALVASPSSASPSGFFSGLSLATASPRHHSHFSLPTTAPSPVSAVDSSPKVDNVLALFSLVPDNEANDEQLSLSSSLPLMALGDGGLGTAAAAVNSEDVFVVDPADFSTVDLLQSLHPEDLKTLSDTLQTRPPTLTASSKSTPPLPEGNQNVDVDIDVEVDAPPSPMERPQGPLFGSPPPLLRVQDRIKWKGKRSLSMIKRQATQGDGSGPSAEGYPLCTAVSNAVLSCYPESNSMLVQNVWSKFIWNNNYPTFIGSGYVDIYLYNANSEMIAANWTDIANDRGMIGILPQDSWFPNETTWADGQNVSIPYFFVITSHGSTLTGGEQHQATFTIVQTAAPSSLVSSSLSSASVLAASLSSAMASLSSEAAHTSRGESSASSNSSLQGVGGGSSFPHWAIAVIVILGLLALLAFIIALYFIFVSARRKRALNNWSENSGSVGSRSPMIQSEGAALIAGQRNRRDMQSPSSSRPGSPLSATDQSHTGIGFAAAGTVHGAAGSTKRESTGATSDTHDGPITSVDASIMADAFRKALRKPEFPPSSDPSPGSLDGTTGPGGAEAGGLGGGLPAGARIRESMHGQLCTVADDEDQQDGGDGPEAREIIDRELASEGRSMTSVDNRKRPEVVDS